MKANQHVDDSFNPVSERPFEPPRNSLHLEKTRILLSDSLISVEMGITEVEEGSGVNRPTCARKAQIAQLCHATITS